MRLTRCVSAVLRLIRAASATSFELKALGDQLQDLLLAEGELSEVEPNLSLGQVGIRFARRDPIRNFGREEGLVLQKLFDSGDQDAAGIALEHAPAHAGPTEGADERFRLVHGQDEDFGLRPFLADLSGSAQAVELGHGEVSTTMSGLTRGLGRPLRIRLAASPHTSSPRALRAPRAVRADHLVVVGKSVFRVMANQPFLLLAGAVPECPRLRRDGNDTGPWFIGRGAGQTRWESGLVSHAAEGKSLSGPIVVFPEVSTAAQQRAAHRPAGERRLYAPEHGPMLETLSNHRLAARLHHAEPMK